MKAIEPIMISGRKVLPLIEGGKGVAVTNGESSGAWALAGGVGTFSGVNADTFDDQGNLIPQVYKGRTRRERHQELIDYAVDGAVYQARVAHEVSGGKGCIHMNVLWEMGGAEEILVRTLDAAKGLIHGVTCGAGMPYKLAEICASHGVYYYPIVSSGRAFRALWKRAYHKFEDWLGAVVYEDPWLAGGHNGLSNVENPAEPEAPLPRVRELRKIMNDAGLNKTPIVMAGGVWNLKEWEDWIDDVEVAPVVFQFGTRPLLTQESPIPDAWKKRLPTLKKGDIYLHRFSPTGFYSSAVNNEFLLELRAQEARQVAYSLDLLGEHTTEFSVGVRNRTVFLAQADRDMAQGWVNEGYSEALRTPDSTLIFVTPEKAQEIRKDQSDCMGCLSACKFSNWAQNEQASTGKKADPRSFCIQKTLQDIAHDRGTENQLMFAGHNAYRFGEDPFYDNGHIPTVKELVARIVSGD